MIPRLISDDTTANSLFDSVKTCSHAVSSDDVLRYAAFAAGRRSAHASTAIATAGRSIVLMDRPTDSALHVPIHQSTHDQIGREN